MTLDCAIQVLTVGTNLQDSSNRAFWQATNGSEQPQVPAGQAWAPQALALELAEGETRVMQADSAAELPSASSDCTTRSEANPVYLLLYIVSPQDYQPASTTALKNSSSCTNNGDVLCRNAR